MTTFEVYRFSLWFYKNSIRWSLPKNCITSLLILTFLKFNEKRNIIHAHRNLISQFGPYEKSKNGARDLQIFEEYVFYQVRKLVTGLQRKWWFSKSLKKPIPVTTIEVYRFSLWFYKNSIRWSLPEFTRVCALAYALTSLSVRPQNPCVLSICDERAFVPKTPAF